MIKHNFDRKADKMILENNELKIIIGKNVPETDAPQIPVEEDKGDILYNIVSLIKEGGYDPVSQLVGFLISDDPTHISNYQNARTMINRLDRDELLEDMVASYLEMLVRKHEKDTNNES